MNSASVVEESFGYLDAPVERIAGADVPMPYAANLERMAVPQVGFPFLEFFLLSYVVSFSRWSIFYQVNTFQKIILFNCISHFGKFLQKLYLCFLHRVLCLSLYSLLFIFILPYFPISIFIPGSLFVQIEDIVNAAKRVCYRSVPLAAAA